MIGTDYKILSFNKQAQQDAVKVFGKPLKEKAELRDYFNDRSFDEFLQDSQKVFNGEHLGYETMLASHWFHIVTSNQQPATSNQQPVTMNHEP